MLEGSGYNAVSAFEGPAVVSDALFSPIVATAGTRDTRWSGVDLPGGGLSTVKERPRPRLGGGGNRVVGVDTTLFCCSVIASSIVADVTSPGLGGRGGGRMEIPPPLVPESAPV